MRLVLDVGSLGLSLDECTEFRVPTVHYLLPDGTACLPHVFSVTNSVSSNASSCVDPRVWLVLDVGSLGLSLDECTEFRVPTVHYLLPDGTAWLPNVFSVTNSVSSNASSCMDPRVWLVLDVGSLWPSLDECTEFRVPTVHYLLPDGTACLPHVFSDN